MIKDLVKNLVGFTTKRKFLVISVDDYGNVRLDSKKAREALDKAGVNKTKSRFDIYDALETRQDLEMLFEALQSVKDKNGNPAVFTPFAMPCNIDFEGMAKDDYREYRYEILPDTYAKLSSIYPESYSGAWELWNEGIEKGIMAPQFHGREHLNLKVFKEKLENRDYELLVNLKNRSYTSISSSGYPTISVTAAFEFWKFEENESFKEIIEDGLKQFEKVYGYKSIHFNPPGGKEHPVLHQVLKDNGVKYIDTAWVKTEHLGEGKYKKVINYTGKKNHLGQTYMVRNVVFEPTHILNLDSVGLALKQIEMAFLLKKPAIISSHRVNFCGHIDPENRKKGIESLKELLQKVVQKWPDVEFIAAHQLGDFITKAK